MSLSNVVDLISQPYQAIYKKELGEELYHKLSSQDHYLFTKSGSRTNKKGSQRVSRKIG
jgi:hypothetical protein